MIELSILTFFHFFSGVESVKHLLRYKRKAEKNHDQKEKLDKSTNARKSKNILASTDTSATWEAYVPPLLPTPFLTHAVPSILDKQFLRHCFHMCSAVRVSYVKHKFGLCVTFGC